MLSIWLGAALLILLALVFVFWPLLVREREQKENRERQTLNVDLYEQRRAELDEQLRTGDLDEAQHAALGRELDLELVEAEKQSGEVQAGPQASSGRIVLLLSAVVLAVFVFGFYQYNGASEDIRMTEAIRAKFLADTQAIQAGKEPDPALARRMMSQLEARLEKDPENVQYLYLLARNASDLQEYPTAINAYRAILAVDESPLVMGELAQLMFVVAGNRITPDAEALIDKTLSVDPNSHVALGLDGIRYYQSEKYQQAIDQWEKAIKLLGPQSPGAQSLAAGVLRARALLAEEKGTDDAGAVAQASPESATEEASALSLKLKIALAEGVQLNPEHAVFVYARAWQGAPMPLAISRLKVKDLPAEIELSEAMAMAPGMSIARFPELELVARVSASGQAVPQPGDWQVTLGPVANSSQDQHLLEIQKQL
ncbi:c-type cytochrome biogenesis protein CcmI [Pseudoteredinibacter isoporae]|uniref:c-type cytochrome biogenesis protein CcmI n=1 Tax=Pseudoteredinibacter isoporae TaxID=570281 RepID=UPI0031029333